RFPLRREPQRVATKLAAVVRDHFRRIRLHHRARFDRARLTLRAPDLRFAGQVWRGLRQHHRRIPFVAARHTFAVSKHDFTPEGALPCTVMARGTNASRQAPEGACLEALDYLLRGACNVGVAAAGGGATLGGRPFLAILFPFPFPFPFPLPLPPPLPAGGLGFCAGATAFAKRLRAVGFAGAATGA